MTSSDAMIATIAECVTEAPNDGPTDVTDVEPAFAPYFDASALRTLVAALGPAS